MKFPTHSLPIVCWFDGDTSFFDGDREVPWSKIKKAWFTPVVAPEFPLNKETNANEGWDA